MSRAVMRQALEALENGKRVRAGEGGTKYQPPLEDSAIDALRAALMEPVVVQEPAVEIKPPNPEGATQCIVRWMAETPAGWVGAWDREALQQFVASPRREWQGLTDQEVWDAVQHGVVGSIGLPSKAIAVARAIEAALKERNHG